MILSSLVLDLMVDTCYKKRTLYVMCVHVYVCVFHTNL